MPIFRDRRTISSLSMPMTGRSTGMAQASSDTVRASMVWLATWPRHSPVTRALHPVRRATRSARRIMNRRMMRVKWSSGQARRISSWISVKGMMLSVIRPHQGVSSRARAMTFSLACWEV